MSIVALTDQVELFPWDSPTSVTAYCEQARRRLERLAPTMTPQHRIEILGELALVHLKIDRLERHMQILGSFRHSSDEWAAGAVMQLMPPAPTSPLEPQFQQDRPAWAFRRRASVG